MIDQVQVDKWRVMAIAGNNFDHLENSQEQLSKRPNSLLKRDIVEAKCQIDRWGVITTDFFFHTSKRSVIRSLFQQEAPASLSQIIDKLQGQGNLSEELVKALNSLEAIATKYNMTSSEAVDKFAAESGADLIDYIWGARVHYLDDMPVDEALGVSLNPMTGDLMENDSESIANSIVRFAV